MGRWGIGIIAVCLLAMPGSTIAGGLPQADQSPQLIPRSVSWEYLRYEARSWAVELTLDLRLSRWPSVQAEKALMGIAQGEPVEASGDETARLTLDMTMAPAFGARVKIGNTVWFDPDDVAALGRYRLRRGEDDFEKTYRFARQGVFRRNREPQSNAERRLEPDRWSRQVASFYPYDAARLGCPVVSDRLLLIYIVSALAPVAAEAPRSVCVFGKRQLHRAVLNTDGRETIAVDYRAHNPAAPARRQAQIEVLKIKLVTEPLASNLDQPENFSFLGMHRDIVFYIDPQTGLPLQIDGRMAKAGSGSLKLREVHLKP